MHRESRLLVVLALALVPAGAQAEKTVFVGSARYDIIVGLSYTRETSPEGEQGGFSRYTSVGRFGDVKFGPSPAPDFDAWFETAMEIPGTGRVPGAVIPMRQISGKGEVTDFEIAPAWEDPNVAIEPKITNGPEPLSPTLELLTYAMAHEDESDETESADDTPLVPLAPTLWFLYSEGASADGSELRWEYPGLALGALDGSRTQFSVLLNDLAEGKDVELTMPFTDGAAVGEWTVQFHPRED